MSEWEKHPRILLPPEGHKLAEELARLRGETMGQVLMACLEKERLAIEAERQRRQGCAN